MEKTDYRLFYLLGVAWFVLNLASAVILPLHPDEAYYWVWSTRPEWGYFDHPPIVAWLISAGKVVSALDRELGVRWWFVLFAAVVLPLLVFSWSGIKRKWLVYLVLGAFPLQHVYSFLALPDSVMLTVTIGFLIAWERFLKTNRLVYSVAAGFFLGLMGLTKYTTVLVAFVVFVPGLWMYMKDWRVWLCWFIAILVLAPHLMWLSQNDWITFRYHLAERNPATHSPVYALEFTPVAIVLAFGGISLPLVMYVILKFRESDVYRAIFILLFWIFMSVLTRVEAHWVYIVYPFVWRPVLRWLDHNWDRNTAVKWFMSLSAIFMILLHLWATVYPQETSIRREFFKYKEVAEMIKDINVHNLPIVVIGSYQLPSSYWFYCGDTAVSFPSVFTRKDQFWLWKLHESLKGRKVLVVTGWQVNNSIAIVKWHQDTFYLSSIDNYLLMDGRFFKVADSNIHQAGNALHVEFQINISDSLPLWAKQGIKSCVGIYDINRSRRLTIRGDHIQYNGSKVSFRLTEIGEKTCIYLSVCYKLSPPVEGEKICLLGALIEPTLKIFLEKGELFA